jgi:fucose 4-O-acetylase-like acetyltransferase
MPFERGDQFILYLAAWFLFTLYFVSIFAGFVYQKNRLFNIGIVLYAVVMMLAFLHIGKNPGNPHWLIFIIKCMFGFGFFSLGYLFKILEPYIKKFILQPIALLILYIVVVSLNEYFGNISYTTLDGDISNKIVFIPIITSLCIILILYSLSYYATKILKEKSFVYTVGEYSFSIMVFHLTFFFLVNVVLYHLSLIPYTALSDVYYRYKIEKLWLIYQLSAIIGPILLVRYYKLLQQKVLYNSYLLYVRFKNVLIR